MNIKPHYLYKKDFKKWFMLPYLKKNQANMHHYDLKTDCSWYWNNDRQELEYFLRACISTMKKALGKEDESCHFMMSGELDVKCDCTICKLFWEQYDKDHVELVCKNCGCHHWLKKDSFAYSNKKKYVKKLGKYNTFNYCFNCAERLRLLDENISSSRKSRKK